MIPPECLRPAVRLNSRSWKSRLASPAGDPVFCRAGHHAENGLFERELLVLASSNQRIEASKSSRVSTSRGSRYERT